MLEFAVKGIIVTASIVTTLFFIRRWVWPINLKIKFIQMEREEPDDLNWAEIERQRLIDRKMEE